MAHEQWPLPVWSIEVAVDRAVFLSRFSELGLARSTMAKWPTDAVAIPDDLEGMTLRCVNFSDEDAFLERDGWIASICVDDGMLRAIVGAGDAATIDAALAELAEIFPRAEAKANTVPVEFWSYGPHGPQSVSRQLDVAPWADVAGNYPPAVRDQLEAMVSDTFRPSHGGQLVLWHGPPGTGKTNALRALAWEWRAWADFHYIVDPDRMFGDHADYLMSVLLAGDSVLIGDRAPASRWRVLLLEDTGELLAADAKEKTGQALSRLLNVVDGMIGQGLRVLVFVTTNEELRALNPAVQRPGRCAAKIEFGTFSEEDARAWLDERDVGGHAGGEMTLADLYAIAADFTQRRAPRRVGFAAV